MIGIFENVPAPSEYFQQFSEDCWKIFRRPFSIFEAF